MGMSASQARLLTITARKNDVELRCQQIANSKMRLSAESEEISKKYSDALRNETIKIDHISLTDGLVRSTLTLGLLMDQNKFSIKTNEGKPVLRHRPDAERLADLRIQTLIDKGFKVKTKDGIEVNVALPVYTGVTPQDELFLAMLSLYAGGNDYYQLAYNAIEAAITILKDSEKDDVAKQEDLHKLILTNNGRNDADDWYSNLDSVDENGVSKCLIGALILSAVWNDSNNNGKYTCLETITGSDAINNLLALEASLKQYQAYVNIVAAENDIKNSETPDTHTAIGDGFLNGEYEIYYNDIKLTKEKLLEYMAGDEVNLVTDKEKIKPYDVIDEKIEKAMKSNPNYLIQGLLQGVFILYDDDGNRIDLTTDVSSSMNIVNDESDDVIAKADYDRDMLKIQNKEKKLEIELNQLNTEHEALNTEYESLKSIISKNIEKSFKIFG